MTRFGLEYDTAARKALRAIRDRRMRVTLLDAIEALMDDPRPLGCLMLAGHRDLWWIRVGDWRVIYRIEDGRLVVIVVGIGGRGQVYRGV
jgi:mRNA interferase RelE/StbE